MKPHLFTKHTFIKNLFTKHTYVKQIFIKQTFIKKICLTDSCLTDSCLKDIFLTKQSFSTPRASLLSIALLSSSLLLGAATPTQAFPMPTSPTSPTQVSPLRASILQTQIVPYIQSANCDTQYQSSQEQLAVVEQELAVAQDELVTAQDQLATMQDQLSSTQDELTQAESEIQSLIDNCSSGDPACASELESTQEELAATQESYLDSLETIGSLEDELERAVNPVSTPVTQDSVVLWADTTGLLVKDSNVMINNATNNMSGVNQLTATTFVGNLSGSVTGAASANVLKTGDTISGNLFITSPASLVATLTGNVTGNLTGNADTATLAGNVTNVNSKTALAVANATTQVETATTIATPNTLVLRDGTGSFSGTTISANSFVGSLVGASSLNVLKTGDTMTGNLFITNGSSLIATVTGNVTGNLTGSVIGASSLNVLKTGDTMTGNLFITNGSSLIATVTGNVTGNLTGSVTGASSLNVLKSGDTMSGNLFITNGSSLVATVTGNVTGNLTGNAATATNVTNVATKTALAVANATTMVESATSAPLNNTLVLRDSAGNFFANTMYLTNNSITSENQVPTKGYVDTAAATGIRPHDPAKVYTDTLILTGTGMLIDNVMIELDDRILTNIAPANVNNGLWVAQLDAWTRPTDFDEPGEANGAYVLINEGDMWGGSSWLVTATALIDTDPMIFAQFSQPGQITAANIGGDAQDGAIFKDKTGSPVEYLNLRPIVAGANIEIARLLPDETIQITAVGAALNTPSSLVARDLAGTFTATTIYSDLVGSVTGNFTGTINIGDNTITNAKLATVSATQNNNYIVARDSVGTFTATGMTATNFYGALTGAASDNVLKSGDTMSGNLFITNGASLVATLTGNVIGDLTGNADTATLAANVTNVSSKSATAVASATTIVETATTIATANTLVLRDGAGNFTSNIITATLIGNVTGTITGDVIGAASDNVLKSGDTMSGNLFITNGASLVATLTGNVTGNLTGNITGDVTGDVTGNFAGSMIGTVTLSNGSASAPSLSFAGNPNTGIFHAATDDNTLRFATNGSERMSIDSIGTVTINALGTGVVHSTGGTLSSSAITNADITDNSITGTKISDNSLDGTKIIDGTITNAKLVTAVASVNTLGAIVARDMNGTFTATKIYSDLVGSVTGNFTGNLIGNVTGNTTGNVTGAVTGTLTGTATGDIVLNNGSAAIPSLRFISDTDTGIYHPVAADTIGFATNGVERMLITTTAIISQDVYQAPWGTAASPSYSFTSDTDTGMFHPASNILTFATNGVPRFEIQDAVVYSGVPIGTAAGNVNTPGYSFQSDPNTGIYHPAAADSIGFVTGGSERLYIDAVGTVTISALGTGVVHSTGGRLSSSLVVDADIANNTISGAKITDSTITGAKIVDLTIANADISDTAAIAGSKLADGGITATQLATSAVTTDKINALAVTDAKIAANAVTTAKILDGNVTNAKLATINTIGKVTNLATTATVTNAGYAIVQRDVSGNFAAGTITHAVGTAPLPSITFAGDTNTGIYHPVTADTMGFAVGGAEIMRTTTAGVNFNESIDLAMTQPTSSFSLNEVYLLSADKSFFYLTMSDSFYIKFTTPGRPGQLKYILVKNLSDIVKTIVFRWSNDQTFIIDTIGPLNDGQAGTNGYRSYFFISNGINWFRI